MCEEVGNANWGFSAASPHYSIKDSLGDSMANRYEANIGTGQTDIANIGNVAENISFQKLLKEKYSNKTWQYV